MNPSKKFQVMLAGKVSDTSKLSYPVIASPKLDGVRAVIRDGIVWSRTNKPIPNKYVQSKLGFYAFNGLDGELICGDPRDKDAYRNTVSAVMREDGLPDFHFHIFDDSSPMLASLPFSDRLIVINAWQSADSFLHWDYVTLVEQTPIRSERELLDYETQCLEAGYEGVMVRSPHGPYKFGRSTAREGYLLKLKRFLDSEAIITGAVELQHNLNDKDEQGKRSSRKEGKTAGGVLGALIVEDLKTHVGFEIGTGFTEEERIALWDLFLAGGLEGLTVKYKYFPKGSKDKPRFPTFLGFRDKRDM